MVSGPQGKGRELAPELGRRAGDPEISKLAPQF
jgi:hypothetical protein